MIGKIQEIISEEPFVGVSLLLFLLLVGAISCLNRRINECKKLKAILKILNQEKQTK